MTRVQIYWRLALPQVDTVSNAYIPYGIHSATEVFQREITSIISDIPGSANSQNRFEVWGKTLQEHDKRLRKVFLKIRESGLKLNKTKCQIKK